jgi:hypothetical protein
LEEAPKVFEPSEEQKVPDPPPGLTQKERLEWYTKDLEDAISPEFIAQNLAEQRTLEATFWAAEKIRKNSPEVTPEFVAAQLKILHQKGAISDDTDVLFYAKLIAETAGAVTTVDIYADPF